MTLTLARESKLEVLLHKMLEPLGRASVVGVYLDAGDRSRWLVKPENSSWPWNESSLRKGHGRAGQRLEVPSGDHGIRALWICTDARTPQVLDAVTAVAEAAFALVAVENERDALCEELGMSYESLASIYEISENRSLLLAPQKATAHVLDRLIMIDEGLQTAFWLADGTKLRPYQWRNTSKPRVAYMRAGILGSALSDGQARIIDLEDDQQVPAELESTFSDARLVAVTPMQHGGEALGVLAAWSRSEGAFDSRFMGLLGALASQVAMIITDDRLRNELIQSERLHQEVEIGGRIQSSLLLGEPPQSLECLDVSTFAAPSRQVGGDFFGFFPHSESTLDVLVGDVMGKGIPAALVGAGVKSQFQRYAISQLATGECIEPASTEAIADRVNQEIGPRLAELGRFVTAGFARFDLERREMQFVDCGHTETLHYRAATRDIVRLRSEWDGNVNLPLGFDPHGTYRALRVSFAPNDVFFFYSDGITEAEDDSGEMFGMDRLEQALLGCIDQTSKGIVQQIQSATLDFAGAEGINDDLTCVSVKLGDQLPPPIQPDFVELGASRGNLPHLYRFLDQTTRAIPWITNDESLDYNIRLAITEATTNVIRHAYGEQVGGKVTVSADYRDETLTVSIKDNGIPFDPTVASDPALDQIRESGFGIYMIRNIMDQVHYSSDGDTVNCLTMVKRRPNGHDQSEC